MPAPNLRTTEYVVVGAGASGCVIARRLVDAGAMVTLVEAGGPSSSLRFAAPALHPSLLDSDADWGFRTEPQAGLGGRIVPWPRGRALGGSTAINALIYLRGARDDYDAWVRAGCVGWSHAEVAPFFARVESYRGACGRSLLGRRGRFAIEDPSAPLPVSRAFVRAASQVLGIPEDHDFDAPDPIGAGYFRRSVRDGVRETAATAYLADLRDEPRLRVRSGALVTRICLERGRAVGVELVVDGATERLHATHEVILSAGAIGSPQLLLLSGIGPADELRAHGLPVVAERSEVGANLHDHVYAPVVYRVREPADAFDAAPAAIATAARAFERGERTALGSNLCEAGAFLRTDGGAGPPDLQFHVTPCAAPPIDRAGVRGTMPDGAFVCLLPTVIHPASRGRLRLRSARPDAPPRLDPRYLEAAADRETLVRGVAIAQAIADATPLRERLGGGAGPCARARGPEAILDAVRATASTMFHPVGTCRMGADEAAVCTPTLEVRGVERLRVADASIMPRVVGGNTQAAAMMIGERASHFLLASAGVRSSDAATHPR